MRSLIFVLLLLATLSAHAYVGPGAGLGVIGAFLGMLLTVILAIAGLVWYPVKRLLRKRSQRVEQSSEA
jgi:hypothetical protein